MIKLLFLSLFAIANCQSQKVIEVGNADRPATGIQFQTGGIRSYSGLLGLPASYGSSIGGARTYQFPAAIQSYSLNAARPAAFSLGNLGYSNLGSYGSYGSYGLGNLGLVSLGNLGVSQYAVRPQAVSLVAAQPHVSAFAAQPVAVVAAQPAATVVAAQPAAAVVTAAQPASFSSVNYGIKQHVSQPVVPVSAAIQSSRTVEYRAVPFSDEPLVPQVVEVEPSEIPLNIHFKSRSSTIQVTQEHQAGQPGTVEQTQSQDEPSRVIHEVVKPVIQEVREIITPYRQVTQEVQPVVEQVHTVVARGEGVRQQYIAQPVVQQRVEQVAQVQQPAISSFAIQQQPAISSFAIQQQPAALAIAQPVAVQQPAVSTLAIAQPVSTFQAVAQPAAVIGQTAVRTVAAQPASFSIGVAQPAVSVQSVRTIQQPASVVSYSAQQPLTGVAVEAQPAVSFRSGSSLLGTGGSSSVVGYGAAQPAVGRVSFTSYSSNSAHHAAADEDESK